MRSSKEKSGAGSVFDVHATKIHEQKKRKTLVDRIYGRNVVNLRPSFKIRHPWILALIIFVVVATTFLGIKNFFTRGAVKNFFPTTCLGTWENPGNAQGIAETTLSASSSFSSDNSAVYDVSGTQIYCGGFVPASFSTSGTLTGVTLNLVWQVGDTPYAEPSSTVISASTTASSSVVLPSSTDESSTDNFPSTTPSSTDSSSPSSFIPLRSLLSNLISKAYAQDDTDTTSDSGSGGGTTDSSGGSDSSGNTGDTTVATPPPVATPTSDQSAQPSDSDTESDSSTAPIILGPPIIANLATDSSTISSTLPDDIANGNTISSSSSTASSTTPSSTVPVIAPPSTPDENFLEVSYSTDGQLWIQLAEVNAENWPNLTVLLPITNWTDLKNLQIKVQGIPTTQNPIPPVYLDGMVVEAHYDIAPDQINTTSTYSQFLTDQPSYTIGQPINIVGAPPSSFIEIYSLNNPGVADGAANVFAAQVDNLGNTAIDSTSLPAGDYMLVNTFEPAACNQYTISQCEARDDYINQIPITVFAATATTTISTSTSTATSTSE